MTDPFNAGITWLDEPLQTSTEGPLAGRTLLVKDLIDTAGVRTTYGSRIYADHVPERTAPAVQGLVDAGAWQRMLAVAARFHTYSLGNQLLIALERRFSTWRTTS